MKRQATLEIAVGMFVMAGLAALFLLAMKVSNLASFAGNNGYDVYAKFDNIGGLKERAPVTMAGVRIGRVSAVEFDPQDFEAKVTLHLDQRYNKIPADTSAKIYTAGLLGENYVALEPGGAEKNLQAGDTIKITQSALVIENLVSRFLYNKTVDSNNGDEAAPTP